MSRVFVDTNVLVYRHVDRDPARQRVARRRLLAEAARAELVIGTQVLHELYATLVRPRQGGAYLTEAEAEQVVHGLQEWEVVPTTRELSLRAIARVRRSRLSLWDALILEAALQARCGLLLSEDFDHGWKVDGLRIEDPFAGEALHEEGPAYGAPAPARRRGARPPRP